MPQKLIHSTRLQVVSLSYSIKAQMEGLSSDQLQTIRHECEEVPAIAPESMRIAAAIVKGGAAAILHDRNLR